MTLFMFPSKNLKYTDYASNAIFEKSAKCMLVFQNYAKTYARTIALHTAGVREIWIDQSRFSRREKLYFPHVNAS